MVKSNFKILVGGKYMKLKSVIAGIEGLKAKGNLELDINAIETDSRKVEKDAMFIAIVGFEVDGHKYINDAIKAGAEQIISNEGIYSVSTIVVDDTREYLNNYLKTTYQEILKK